VLATLAPLLASAQVVATNFQELRFKVKPGDTAYVTDENGHERKVRILDLSASSLGVRLDDARREFSERSVRRIRQRLPDPLMNGAVIGGVSIVTLSTVGALAFADRSEGESFGWADAGFILYLGAIGAGIGTGIDAVIQERKTIYERAGVAALQVRVAPMVSRHGWGAKVSPSEWGRRDDVPRRRRARCHARADGARHARGDRSATRAEAARLCAGGLYGFARRMHARTVAPARRCVLDSVRTELRCGRLNGGFCDRAMCVG
jgi:hypothetical protein